MHKITLSVIFFIFLGIFSIAQPSGFHSLKDEAFFRTKFTETATKLNTIQADFIQVKSLNILEEKISSKGKFWFKKENKVRMEYTSPYKYLLIINQDKMTIQDETKTTTLSSKSNKLLEYVNKIMIDCIQGTAIDSKEFVVKVFENDKQYLLEMLPSKKEMKEFFSDIRLYIEKSDYSVQRMEMIEPGGDNTMFTFLNKKFNEKIEETIFTVQ
jgi:outer membrane lipoprotein-sorting protein